MLEKLGEEKPKYFGIPTLFFRYEQMVLNAKSQLNYYSSRPRHK